MTVTSVDTATGEVVAEPLSDDEQARCEELETRIARGLRSFREVGDALVAIRDGRLYRDRYASFETYCEAQWGLTRRHADRLAAAAEVAAILEVDEVGPIGLTSESQARELAPLRDDPAAMREAYEQAVKEAEGEPTAEGIRKVVKQRTAVKAPDELEPDPEREMDARQKKAADDAHNLADRLSRYEVVHEKTIRLMEARCKRWRSQ